MPETSNSTKEPNSCNEKELDRQDVIVLQHGLAKVRNIIGNILKLALYSIVGLNLDRYFRTRAQLVEITRSLALYEAQNLNFLRRLVKQGDVAIDVGANFGIYTSALTALVGTTGKVIAFEPNEIVYRLLRSRITTHNVEVHHLAISDFSNKTISLHTPLLFGCLPEPALTSMFPFRCSSQLSTVPVATLDSLVSSIPRVNFIKLDIEGAELPALRGATAVVSKHRPYIQLEINHPEKDLESLQKLAAEFDYKLFQLNSSNLREVTCEHPITGINFYLLPAETPVG